MSKTSFSVLRTRKRKRSSAARDSLIEAVRNLLRRYHPSEITTSMVLAEANVARGTLYLHFEDFSSLVEVVLLEAFSESVEESIHLPQNLVDGATTKKAFIKAAEKLTESSQGPGRRAFRFSRLRLIAYAEKNQRFAKLLAEEQTRLNKKFEEIFVLLKKKGWLNKGLDIKAVVIFVQAYTLGQIIDDVAGEKMSSEGWNHLIGQIIEKVLIAH
jgi:AcrR family transcriptional regulator